jgi:hypothetical protein
MTKQEFFNKIDEIRQIANHLFMTEDDTEEWQVESKNVITMLDELKSDAEQLLEDEYDTGYNLGLDRGFLHIDDEDEEF